MVLPDALCHRLPPWPKRNRASQVADEPSIIPKTCSPEVANKIPFRRYEDDEDDEEEGDEEDEYDDEVDGDEDEAPEKNGVDG